MTDNRVKIFMKNIAIVGGFNLRKPRLFKKLTKGYIKARFCGENTLRFLDIALSYKCNFQCEHCSAISMVNRERNELSLEEYAEIAKQALSAGVINFHFTGGEPLLHDKLFDIIKLFRPNESLISVQTNGWYVDQNFIDEYKTIGGDILCVSLDSTRDDDHDSFRNKKGSWKRAVDAMSLGVKNGLTVVMGSTVSHKTLNSDEMKGLIQMSKDMGVILSLNLAVPIGGWTGAEDQLLNSEDRRILNELLKKNIHMRTDFESNWCKKGCPAFKEKCYISPYGDVSPCPFIPISFGNVREMPLVEIRKKALQFDYLSKYHSICIAAEDKHFIQNSGCYEGRSIHYTESSLFSPEQKPNKQP